ncbi:MAG TPA: hypothetical protein PLJ60_00660 [Chryseolinea sp.]|nr:hypothetical protein [Chryseolinea sp.]HPH46771.1 hypothetical protein [Chryseolinea sp.]HPM28818.1 hypothetical protein [Chryseolinea sp.]
MKKILLISSVVLMSCGGSMSDEQRKRLHEGMEQQKIVKMNDSEIVLAAMEQGRTFYSVIERLSFDSTKIDSVAKAYGVRAVQLDINSSKPITNETEKQLLDAYISAAATGSMTDNIQKIRKSETDYDSLIYSKPIVVTKDGVENVTGIWNIYLAKKQVIISASKK